MRNALLWSVWSENVKPTTGRNPAMPGFIRRGIFSTCFLFFLCALVFLLILYFYILFSDFDDFVTVL